MGNESICRYSVDTTGGGGGGCAGIGEKRGNGFSGSELLVGGLCGAHVRTAELGDPGCSHTAGQGFRGITETPGSEGRPWKLRCGVDCGSWRGADSGRHCEDWGRRGNFEPAGIEGED